MTGSFPTWDTMRALEAENAELRAKLRAVLAVPYCRDVGHPEAIHLAIGCCDPYVHPICPGIDPERTPS